MTTSSSNTITEPQIKPCPPWCTLPPGHGWDSIHDSNGLMSRGHGGPKFGAYLFGGSTEMNTGEHTTEVHMWCDGSDLSPSQLLDLAADAIAARVWLESVR